MTILSGNSSTEEQMRDNLQTFGDFQPLTKEEYQVIEKVVKKGCRICLWFHVLPAATAVTDVLLKF